MTLNEIIFITTNENKLKEVRKILGGKYHVLSLKDVEHTEEIPEPFDTIKENSNYKANYFFEEYGVACLAEDSGLEVDYLGNKPGAYSARYAGEPKNDAKNIEKLLSELKNIENRKARFLSVFSYRDENGLETFEGIMNGFISESPIGNNGFGYDPVFIADGQSLTNAEMTLDQKNEISHRKIGLSKFVDFYNKYTQELNLQEA